ncbi:hypothetical protein KAU40_01460 [Candidatus Parcubacteria bacterium]|nr:hypothetical protein [Candidatus Parcubacteria bacterium]
MTEENVEEKKEKVKRKSFLQKILERRVEKKEKQRKEKAEETIEVTPKPEEEERIEETEEDREVRKVIEDIKAKAQERKRWVPIAEIIPIILSVMVTIWALLNIYKAITIGIWTTSTISLLVISLIIVLVGFGYLKRSWVKVPSAEVWMVEVLDGFYKELKEGAYLVPYWLMKIPENKKVSKKELRISLFTKGERVELPKERGTIGMVAEATVIADKPIRICYSVVGGTTEIRDDLVPAKLQDAIQTYLKDFALEDVVALRGGDISKEIQKWITRDFSRWGVRLVTLLLKDFDIPEQLQKYRTKVYEADREIEIAEKLVERKRLEGEAEGKKIDRKIEIIGKGIQEREDIEESEAFQEARKEWEMLQKLDTITKTQGAVFFPQDSELGKEVYKETVRGAYRDISEKSEKRIKEEKTEKNNQG